MSNHTNLSINVHPDPKVAPRYTNETPLTIEQVVVTEKGTVSDLPIVDFQLVDDEGKKYWFSLTGRLCNTLSAVIRGTNMRNHGVEEP